MSTEHLLNMYEIARRTGVDRGTVDKAIKRAKLQPVTSYAYGRGLMRLYKDTDALAVVEKFIRSSPALSARFPPKPPVAPPPPVISLAGVEEELEAMRTVLGNELAILKGQQVAMFKMLEHLREGLDAINLGLGIVQVPDDGANGADVVPHQ